MPSTDSCARGEAGHLWVGYDISPSMLRIARGREAGAESSVSWAFEVDGDLFLADAGGVKAK